MIENMTKLVDIIKISTQTKKFNDSALFISGVPYSAHKIIFDLILKP